MVSSAAIVEREGFVRVRMMSSAYRDMRCCLSPIWTPDIRGLFLSAYASGSRHRMKMRMGRGIRGGQEIVKFLSVNLVQSIMILL